MVETTKHARVAGGLYLLLAVVAPVRLMYIQGAIFVPGNPEATALNIVSREGLFRFGMLTDVMAGLLGTIVALSLYRLFRETDRDLAALLVVFGGVPVTVLYFVTVLTDAATLVAALNPPYLAGFDQQQRIGLVGFFARLHGYIITIAQVLWGIWLVPLGMLILKSRLLPRFIAVWLFLNAGAYVLTSALGLLSPRLDAAVSGFFFPLLLGEIAFMLWLVFGRLPREPAAA
jgi:uncharacterized membrane protein YeaQ/YmgE (transglycosylase-associated protein family)